VAQLAAARVRRLRTRNQEVQPGRKNSLCFAFEDSQLTYQSVRAGQGALRRRPRMVNAFQPALDGMARDHWASSKAARNSFALASRNLMSTWIPALEGVEAKLRVGASWPTLAVLRRVHDFDGTIPIRIGVVGFDYHDAPSPRREPRRRRPKLPIGALRGGSANELPGTAYDSYGCSMPSRHGRPGRAAKHVLQSLRQTPLDDRRTFATRSKDNLNPIGGSTIRRRRCCAPPAPGRRRSACVWRAQAGEAVSARSVTAGVHTLSASG